MPTLAHASKDLDRKFTLDRRTVTVVLLAHVSEHLRQVEALGVGWHRRMGSRLAGAQLQTPSACVPRPTACMQKLESVLSAMQAHVWSLQKRPEFKEVFGDPVQPPAAEARPPRDDRRREPQQQVYLRFKSRATDSA